MSSLLKYFSVAFLSVFFFGLTTFATSDAQKEKNIYFEQKSKITSITKEKSELLITGEDSFVSTNSPLAFKDIGYFKVTAYSSTPDQTDNTPFIMASGKYVYDGAVATNFLPLGTKVRFPEIFGDKVFTVEDRMNKRFQDRIDIWMETRSEAIKFGVKYTKIQIAK